MPKKRTFNFKQLQGPKPPAATNGESSTKPSVNERLSELRKLEGKDAAAKKRLLADSANQRSVPQDVQKVLGVPESAPPKPKRAVRTRERLRTPGPAPPKSWLAGGSRWWTSTLAMRGGRTSIRKRADLTNRSRPDRVLRFAQLTGLKDGPDLEAVHSLTHFALKSVAESWHLFDEEDYPALAEIPLRLRLRVISYIGFYGAPLDVQALDALLTGVEQVQALDLAGLIGHSNLTVKKVAKLIDRDEGPVADHARDSVVDSWDAEDSLEAALAPSIRSSRFSNLTHLCLSHPGPAASWRDLLGLAKHAPQTTHLSLASWPRPTLTPNLSTATVSSTNSPDVTAGASHYYSGLDQDFTEPVSILRQLSSHLLCLQWLDLEGCPDWVPAFAQLAVGTAVVPHMAETSVGRDDWTAYSSSAPSVLASNWKNLTYLRCAQGWLPRLLGVQYLHERDTSIVDRLLIDGILKHLQRSETPSEAGQASMDMVDFEKKRARLWLETEYRLTYACMRINSARRAEGCRPLGMDFGWTVRNVSVP